MLSRKLNALVSPTIQRTVTAPPTTGCVNGQKSVTRTPDATRTVASADLDAQPELPAEPDPVVDQPHDHDQRRQAEDQRRARRPASQSPPAYRASGGRQPGPAEAERQGPEQRAP